MREDFKPDLEVRLGLVMYGGVSLAIYIYGVASEFFHLVEGDVPEYWSLKRLLEADVVVDVMSGASAGGVNAVLLGRALTNDGADFEVCGDLWRERADFLALLQEPLAGSFEEGDIPMALFRSKAAYQDELEKALHKIRSRKRAENPRALPSPTEALDVFLTGTDIRGRVWSETDSLGSNIQVKDHRVVFHLKHREESGRVRKSAFDPNGGLSDESLICGLAAIARTTSAFPVAFRPVQYDPAAKEPYVELMQKVLPDHARDTKAWFTDGGVLDNKPFTQAIETIYHRKTHRLVDRKLFYVEPDPERFLAAKVEEPLPEAVAMASITSIPGYESIADDIARLEDHNRRVRFFKELIEGETDQHVHDPRIYDNARRAEMIDWIEGRLDDLGIAFEPMRAEVERTARQVLQVGADSDQGLRRCFFTIYRLYEKHRDMRGALTAGEEIASLFQSVQLLRIVNFACELAIADVLTGQAKRAASGASGGGSEGFARAGPAVLDDLAPRLAGVLAPVDDATVRDEEKLHAELKARALKATGTWPLSHSVVDQILESTTLTDEARALFSERFELVDRWLFPLQAASGVQSQDEIELTRISPFDTRSKFGYAARWNLAAPEKISGDALFHFGGFIKRAWRSNDVFWGKCDAAEILIDSLLNEERLALVLERHPAPEKLLSDVIADLNLEASERPKLTLDLPPAKLVEELKCALVRSAHRRIAKDDVPKVAYDLALEEGTARVVDRAELRDSLVDEAMIKAAGAGRWSEVDKLAKHWISTIGGEDLTQVAPLRLGRVITQTGLLVTRILRARAEKLSVFGKAGGRVVHFTELILSLLYVLARSMEINAFLNALLVTAFGTAFGISLVMVVLMAASTKQFPDGLPLAIVGISALMFTFAKHVLAIRVQPAAFRVRGIFGMSALGTAMIGLFGATIIGIVLRKLDPIIPDVTDSCDLLRYAGVKLCGMVSLEIAGASSRAFEILSAWHGQHRFRYALLSLVLDQPFVLFYVMLGVMAARFTTAMLARAFRDRPEAVISGGFIEAWTTAVRIAGLCATTGVVVAGLLDVYENVTLATMIWEWKGDAPALPDQTLVTHAFWSATIKFRLLAFTASYVLGGTIGYGIIRLLLRTRDVFRAQPAGVNARLR